MALNVGELEATLKLRDELSAKLAEANKKIGEFSGEVQKTTTVVGGSSTALAGLSRQIAGAFTVGAAIAFTKQIMDTADQIQKMSDRTGIGTTEIQKLDYIAGQTSVSLESLVSAAQNLQQRLGSRDEGTVGALNALGIAANDFNRLNTYQQMTALSTAILKIEDPTKQAAVAAALFGKTWKEILPALKADMKTVGDQAITMSDDAVKGWDAVGDSLKRVSQATVSLSGNMLSFMQGTFADWVSQFNPSQWGVRTSAILATAGAINDPNGLLGALQSVKKPTLEVTEGATALTMSLDDTKRATDALDLAMVKQEGARKAAEDFKKVKDAVKEVESEMFYIPDALLKIGAAVDVAKFGAVADDLANVEQNARIANFGYQGMAGELVNVGEKTTLALDKMDGWAEVGPKLIDARDKVKSIGDALEDVAANLLQTLARAFEGGGNVIGAIKSLASQAGQAFADTYGEALGTQLNVGAKIGGGIIGAGVGAIIGGVSALTGWLRDGMKRDFERIGQEWGVNISEGLAKQLQEDVKSGKYKTELAALTSELGKLIQEAGGLDKSNLGNFTQKLRLSFSELERGGLTTAQVTKILDENWRAFIEAGTDGNGRLSAGLKEIIQLNERFGTQSKEIAAYVQGQALAAMQGFAAVVAGLVATTDASERSKQSLDDLGIQALATFNAAVQGGMSTASALKEIAPALSALKGQYDALGLTIDDTALRSLLFQGDFVANNPAVVAAVDGLTQQMIALDNIGRETVAVFEAQQRTGFDAYTRIQDAVAAMGGSTEDALALMQTFLQQAFIEAQELGVPLDANTQMLINQSKELGLWRDQGKSANDVIVEGFERLGDRLGEFTAQIAAAVEAISQIPTAVPEPWEQWSPPPALPDYQVEMIPAPWDNWGAPPIDSSFLIPQSFARGGPVYAAEGFWKPRGTDTVPAMLTPGERVLSVPEARAWEAGARGAVHSPDIVAELRHIRSVLSLLPESVATASRDAVLLASA